MAKFFIPGPGTRAAMEVSRNLFKGAMNFLNGKK